MSLTTPKLVNRGDDTVIKILIAATMITAFFTPAWADGEKSEEGGFLSEAISSVTSKVSEVASGKEKIIDEDAKGVDDAIFTHDYSGMDRRSSDQFDKELTRMRRSEEDAREGRASAE